MTYWALRCVKKCDPWAWRRNEKKNSNFHASNWLFAQTTRVDVGLWNFACWVVSSFMKIGRGVSEMWRVENRHLPLTWPMAYTTACTTVQAVIIKMWRILLLCGSDISVTSHSRSSTNLSAPTDWHCLMNQCKTYRVETLMGVFRLQKLFWFSSFFIPCSGVYISLPCGERKFIAYACLLC